MKSARTHSAVTNISNGHDAFLLHTSCEQYACHYGNHVAQVGDRTDKASLPVTKVNIEIFTARRSPRLRHILRKDIARTDSLDKNRTEVTNQRRQKIVPLERVGTAYCGGFLAQRAKDTPNNFCLTI